MTSGNGWEEYQHLVLAELERHNRWMTDVDSKVTTIVVDMALLKKLLENQEKFNRELTHRQDIFEKSIDKRLRVLEIVRSETKGENNVKKWFINAIVPFLSALSSALITYLIIGR
jgi:transcription elongation GreA/GreB family factor